MLFGLTRKTSTPFGCEPPLQPSADQQIRNGKTKIRHIQEPRGHVTRHPYCRPKGVVEDPTPDFLFCPVKRRSYVGNAGQHPKLKKSGCLDVEAYFPSTPRHRVFWFFHTIMRCSRRSSSCSRSLLTVDDHLATGSTVSPIMRSSHSTTCGLPSRASQKKLDASDRLHG